MLAEDQAAAPETAAHREPVAQALGVNVHAKQLVDGRNRAALERLCRYILRPPLAQERLTVRPDGRLELAFKRAWRDGTRAIVLEPEDLLVRLCAAVPPPWFNLTRYFGVFSSHSQHRREVTAHLSPTPGRFSPEPATGDQLQLPGLFGDGNATAEPSSGRSRWSWLLAHVFRADLETCSRCGGAMRWVEVATKPQAIARLLAKHGLGPQPPPPAAPVTPVEQLVLPLGS
jgi:hypothetical protein